MGVFNFKILILCGFFTSWVLPSEAFAPFAWASNKYRYRAAACKSRISSSIRALTKKENMRVCLAVALESLGRKNSLLERSFDVKYDHAHRRLKSYDPALKNVMQYTMSRRLKKAYYGDLPFYSPYNANQYPKMKGDFFLKAHSLCGYPEELQGEGGKTKINRLIHGLSHLDFYGVFDGYRYTILQGIKLKTQPGIEDALNRLRKRRVKLMSTLHYLVSLRRHLEGKTTRDTPTFKQCMTALNKESQWILDYARIKILHLQTPYCQVRQRECRRDFESIDGLASTVQAIVDIMKACKVPVKRPPL